MAEPRSILHLDMDAFYAAVEQREDKTLRGKPVLIGHDGPRGVVATASYEARVFGCHSAQPMAVARRRCPQAVILPVNGALYSAVSAQLFAILEDFSPVIEPLSIDEAFLDLTGTRRLLGEPREVAMRIKRRIAEELDLTASAGVAGNKFLAKLASDMNKPDGLTVIDAEDVDTVLPPLPVTRLWGIGRASAEKLARSGVTTIGELRARPTAWLRRVFGGEAETYYNLARGIDRRPVVPDRQAKSISHEQTFTTDVAEPDEVRRVLLDQVEQVAGRLRRAGFKTRGVSLKIRFGDFQTISRSMTLEQATDVTARLWEAAQAIFAAWPFQPVRLIGFAAERLARQTGQMLLFAEPSDKRDRRLDDVADRINARYGKRTIRRGGV